MINVSLHSRSEILKNSAEREFGDLTEAVSCPSHGRYMTSEVKLFKILLRCLKHSMFTPFTRAPNLLLRPSTGRSSVRLFRFHVARPFEDGLMTHRMVFLQNSYDIYSLQRQVIFEILMPK